MTRCKNKDHELISQGLDFIYLLVTNRLKTANFISEICFISSTNFRNWSWICYTGTKNNTPFINHWVYTLSFIPNGSSLMMAL